MIFTVESWNPFTGVRLGVIEHSSIEYNEPVYGFGEFNLEVPVSRYDAEILRGLTNPNQVLITVRADDSFQFVGIPKVREKAPATPNLTIHGISLKGWFYSVFASAEAVWSDDEQVDIGADLVNLALARNGAPSMTVLPIDTDTNRDFTLQAWDSFGDALDKIGKREGGFEWDVTARYSTVDGTLEPLVEFFPGGQPRVGQTVLFLDHKASTNSIAVGVIPEDYSEAGNYHWALGEGQYPDQPVSNNDDPEIGASLILVEKVSNWSGVTKVATLTDHAVADRLRESFGTQTFPVDHDVNNPSIHNYRPGDRCRIRVDDGWNNFDYSGARIRDRAVRVGSGGSVATIVVDIIDQVDFSAQE